jgi:Domain of unknown function (DUF4386)
MVDRKSLRLSATLLLIGSLVSIVEAGLQPRQANPNNHLAKFAEIAHSADWTIVQLLEFVGVAVFLVGLLVLFFALGKTSGTPRWLGLFGAIAAGVALALYGVLQAVDGVALKQAVDAWASAPAAEQATHFASAEAIRWLEWGTHSYQNFMFGLAVVLLALVIVWTARVPRPIGYLMGLSGLAIIVQGWVVGTEGFSVPSLMIPTILGDILWLAWSIWLLIVAWRMKESVQAAPA